jgi:hypothetical protein
MLGAVAHEAKRGLLRFTGLLRRSRTAVLWAQSILLGATFLLALAWLLWDASFLEPITLMASLGASLASLWLPRLVRPIAAMEEVEIRRLIAASDPTADWFRVQTLDNSVIFAYRWDNALEVWDHIMEDASEPFVEEWLPASWNGNSRRRISVRCGHRRVFEMYLLNVDGGRSTLPMPAGPSDLRITRLQDVLARVVNEPQDEFYTYSKYRDQAGLIEVDTADLSARST